MSHVALRCSHPAQLSLFCCSSVKPAELSYAVSCHLCATTKKCCSMHSSPVQKGFHGVEGWDCVKKICMCLTCSGPWGICFGPCLEEGCVAMLHSGLVPSGCPYVLFSLCMYFPQISVEERNDLCLQPCLGAGHWLGSVCSACSEGAVSVPPLLWAETPFPIPFAMVSPDPLLGATVSCSCFPSLPENFTLLSRVRNKPYDVFGCWLNETNLISGNLHRIGRITSCSVLWLNNAFQVRCLCSSSPGSAASCWFS